MHISPLHWHFITWICYVVFHAWYACFKLPTHLNLSDQLGARFDDIRKSCPVRAVETFNSTKKKMGICFTVSNMCFPQNFIQNKIFDKKWSIVLCLIAQILLIVNALSSNLIYLSRNRHLYGKCLTVSSWCRHQTEGRLYIGKVPPKSCWNFALIHLHLTALQFHLIQRRYVFLAHSTSIDLFNYSSLLIIGLLCIFCPNGRDLWRRKWQTVETYLNVMQNSEILHVY